MTSKRQWIIWLTMTLGLMAYLGFSLVSQPNAASRVFLPGKTTHGHYQIELQCHECHSEEIGAGVSQDACIRCHGEDLERSSDTHPKSKFTDPGKFHLVKRIDGRVCITCHQEHVPDRTLSMGLSLPADYCWHCHQEVAEQRPSHQGLAYDSCASAGCHNYHDNRALIEKFLVSHHGEPDMLKSQQVPARNLAAVWLSENDASRAPLSAGDHDAPQAISIEKTLLSDWASTAHAAAGVNCMDCHKGEDAAWIENPNHSACQECHGQQVEGFTQGRHGMRLAAGLDPMTLSEARLPMNHGNLHAELNCVACHGSHRFDTGFAAADACLQCHDDDHSRAYVDSPHHELWRRELAGDSAPGTGVSCATCHMPRQRGEQGVFVQHNQNNNLRPNEKMVRTVCSNCHGLQFTLDALADETLIENNFRGSAAEHIKSIDMAKAWSDERARLREKRRREKDGG